MPASKSSFSHDPGVLHTHNAQQPRQYTNIEPRRPKVRLEQLTATGFNPVNKTILDYMGNRGNLLEDGVDASLIKPENYTCMDMDTDPMSLLTHNIPTTTTMLYNGHHHILKPGGQKNLPFPQADKSFDTVVSFNGFNRTLWEDFLFEISEMLRVSKGAIYVCIYDPISIKYMHRKRKYEFGTVVDLEDITGTESAVYFIDNDTVINVDDDLPDSYQYLLTYYNPEWLLSELRSRGYGAWLHRPIFWRAHVAPGAQPFLEIWSKDRPR